MRHVVLPHSSPAGRALLVYTFGVPLLERPRKCVPRTGVPTATLRRTVKLLSRGVCTKIRTKPKWGSLNGHEKSQTPKCRSCLQFDRRKLVTGCSSSFPGPAPAMRGHWWARQGSNLEPTPSEEFRGRDTDPRCAAHGTTAAPEGDPTRSSRFVCLETMGRRLAVLAVYYPGWATQLGSFR